MRKLLAVLSVAAAAAIAVPSPPASAAEPSQANVYAVVASPLNPGGPVVTYQAAGWVSLSNGPNTAAAGQCSAEAVYPGQVVDAVRVVCWIEGNSVYTFGDATTPGPVSADSGNGTVWYSGRMDLCMRAYVTVGGVTSAYPIACGEFHRIPQ